MKLEELLEVNFQSVDTREPSGVSSPTTVDPDKVRAMQDRSKSIRKKWKIARNMRRPNNGGQTVKGDNEDLTGSGANGMFNGSFKY